MRKSKKIIILGSVASILLGAVIVFAVTYPFWNWPSLHDAAGKCLTCRAPIYIPKRSAQTNPCAGFGTPERVWTWRTVTDVGGWSYYCRGVDRWRKRKCQDYHPKEKWTCASCCVEPVYQLSSASTVKWKNIEKVPKTINLGSASATCPGGDPVNCWGKQGKKLCLGGCCNSCTFGRLDVGAGGGISGYLYCNRNIDAEVLVHSSATYNNHYTIWQVKSVRGSCSGCSVDWLNTTKTWPCSKCTPSWTFAYCPNSCSKKAAGTCSPPKAPDYTKCYNRSTKDGNCFGYQGAWRWKVLHDYTHYGVAVGGLYGCGNELHEANSPECMSP